MQRTVFSSLVGLLALAACGYTGAEELSDDNFSQLQKLINPQPGESLWRGIAWETRLNAARRKAAAEGKPLLVWAGGGSAPLGGC